MCARFKVEETRWKLKLVNTVTIPQSVLETLINLRYSTINNSDYVMIFSCQDQVKIIAHPPILAAASPYFARFFAGPW
jgi:hypothetical protein